MEGVVHSGTLIPARTSSRRFQVAIEHGRKGIAGADRPTIDEVESATVSGARAVPAAA